MFTDNLIRQLQYLLKLYWSSDSWRYATPAFGNITNELFSIYSIVKFTLYEVKENYTTIYSAYTRLIFKTVIITLVTSME